MAKQQDKSNVYREALQKVIEMIQSGVHVEKIIAFIQSVL